MRTPDLSTELVDCSARALAGLVANNNFVPRCLLSETSLLDPMEGIRYRGMTLQERTRDGMRFEETP